MIISPKTRVFDILEEYGDIASVMMAMGVEPVAKYSIRRFITRFINVRMAAFVHKVELNEFIDKINKAIKEKEQK